MLSYKWQLLYNGSIGCGFEVSVLCPFSATAGSCGRVAYLVRADGHLILAYQTSLRTSCCHTRELQWDELVHNANDSATADTANGRYGHASASLRLLPTYGDLEAGYYELFEKTILAYSWITISRLRRRRQLRYREEQSLLWLIHQRRHGSQTIQRVVATSLSI